VAVDLYFPLTAVALVLGATLVEIITLEAAVAVELLVLVVLVLMPLVVMEVAQLFKGLHRAIV
jgi:hypothetical protein